jgi:hypothetical protein
MHAGSGDAVQPRDTESVITAVAPALPAGIQIDIVGSDTFVRIRSQGHDVQIPGYQDEPYIHITQTGEVLINDASPTSLLNSNRYGNVDMSKYVESNTPKWRTIAANGVAMWHDHRVHWMSPKPPAVIDAKGTVLDWTVPVVIDKSKIVVSGTLFLRSKATVLWWLVGLVVVLLGVFLSLAKRQLFVYATAITALIATIIGAVQWMGLPNGARITPLLLMFSAGAFVIAIAASVLAHNSLRPQHIAVSLHAGAGATMAVCAWLLASVVRAAYVPGVEPAWLLRAIIPAMMGMGCVAMVDGVMRIVRNTTD